MDLYDACGIGAAASWTEAEAAALATAVGLAAAHQAGGLSSVYADGDRDIRLGRREWNEDAGDWTDTWGVPPYNMIEVTLRRSVEGSDKGDQPLQLFFGRVLGEEYTDITVTATVCFLAGNGFRPTPSQNANVMPFAYDEESWNEYLDGAGPDEWSYDPDTGEITPGPDGIREIDFYPYTDDTVPSGNRGALDIGKSGASNIADQILNGLSEEDLEGPPFNGEFSVADGPLLVGGEPGIMSSLKDELEAVKGLPRGITIFSHVENPGRNATYTVVEIIGIRVMAVKLTGSPNKRYVIAQPTMLSDQTVTTTGDGSLETATILGPLSLIK